jgi:hypothetical protein
MLHYTLEIRATITVEPNYCYELEFTYEIFEFTIIKVVNQVNEYIFEFFSDNNTQITKIALQESLNGINP